jgi:alkaline phosphatase D
MRRIRSGMTRFQQTRRSFVANAGLGIATLIAAPAVIRRAIAQQQSWRAGDPFSLGVASGSPRPDGFVLWTRLAPAPLSTDPATPGGVTDGPLSVSYEIASDPGMRDVVLRGTANAEPEFAHSVHVEVSGLKPGRPYWYRFMSGDAVSRLGRAITAPAPGSALERLRFGFVSCSNYEVGYFSGYRHLCNDNPDFALFLGDYIYDTVEQRRPTVRKHADGVKSKTLTNYRNRYGQYQLDPDLQRLRAEVPALVTWDDHEVANDYGDQWSETFDDPATFLLQRAAAYQAFYENMPVRPSLSRPTGPSMRVYDRFTFGDLAEISMIDGRQYRSRQACYRPPDHGNGHGESIASCPELADPARSMIGLQQEAWLFDGLARSPALWNVIGQDVLMAHFHRKGADGIEGSWTDDWNGFPASRTRLLQHIGEAHVSNAVVLGGDIHSFWANDLKLNFDDPRSPTVATEFIGTSISALPVLSYEAVAPRLPEYPHVHFFESRRRGYAYVDVDRRQMNVHFRALSDATDPNASAFTLKTFMVENGHAGVLLA